METEYTEDHGLGKCGSDELKTLDNKLNMMGLTFEQLNQFERGKELNENRLKN